MLTNSRVGKVEKNVNRNSKKKHIAGLVNGLINKLINYHSQRKADENQQEVQIKEINVRFSVRNLMVKAK